LEARCERFIHGGKLVLVLLELSVGVPHRGSPSGRFRPGIVFSHIVSWVFAPGTDLDELTIGRGFSSVDTKVDFTDQSVRGIAIHSALGIDALSVSKQGADRGKCALSTWLQHRCYIVMQDAPGRCGRVDRIGLPNSGTFSLSRGLASMTVMPFSISAWVVVAA